LNFRNFLPAPVPANFSGYREAFREVQPCVKKRKSKPPEPFDGLDIFLAAVYFITTEGWDKEQQ
jgi:hypothetical protein